MVSVGEKYDDGKPRFDLIPPRAELAEAMVLTFGVAKYAEGGWKSVPDAKSRYMAAALRHIAAYRRGETTDPESGLPHLAHARCCLGFLLEMESNE